MTIEDELKQFILSKYGSITNFCKKINMSQSTLSTIFARGIQRTSITKMIEICDELGISVDALAQGEIVPKEMIDCNEYADYDYIFDHMLIDGKKLNEYEIFHMKNAFHHGADIIRDMRKTWEPDFMVKHENDIPMFVKVNKN